MLLWILRILKRRVPRSLKQPEISRLRETSGFHRQIRDGAFDSNGIAPSRGARPRQPKLAVRKVASLLRLPTAGPAELWSDKICTVLRKIRRARPGSAVLAPNQRKVKRYESTRCNDLQRAELPAGNKSGRSSDADVARRFPLFAGRRRWPKSGGGDHRPRYLHGGGDQASRSRKYPCQRGDLQQPVRLLARYRHSRSAQDHAAKTGTKITNHQG